MARGTKLQDIRAMVMSEISDTATPNLTRIQQINTLISNKQKWLASTYDFPFLQHFFDVQINPGQQYATLPGVYADDSQQAASINFERPVTASVFWNLVYDDMYYGIGQDEYNWMNNALGQQTDPIQRWRMVTNASEPISNNQFEVWPVPVTPQIVRFTAQRLVLPLDADSDVADLDDMLLTYFVAGEILVHDSQPDGPLKLQMAKERLERNRAVYPVRERAVILGQGKRNWREQRRVVPMIIVAHGAGH
jgi:hypothetical protein